MHRLTGTAPAVALHFPWDAVEDYGALRDDLSGLGLRVGAVNPNLFQDPDYRLGSITNPDAGIRDKALDHLLECVEIAPALGRDAQSLWFADGTNYAGQDDLRARRRRLEDGLSRLYAACPRNRSCWSSTSSSSPRSTRPTSRTGARRCCSASARRAGQGAGRPRPSRAGRQRRADRRAARARGAARRLSLQQPQVRRRRPDRRLGQPVRAVPDLLRAGDRGPSCRA